MGDDIKWLIGISASLGVSFMIALVGSFRSLSATMKDGDDQLHERINRVRDEYVKRVDHDAQMNEIKKNIKEIRDELRDGTKETNKRLDQVLAALVYERK
ncbi:hypothetical protein [Pseudochrobactrum asaccharolyticum]|uniref:Uncharacterized protein n=1 Tax=Pseudochrobactrum asaccharolyticum TaxID=354351 RepID=A0A366DLQ3_9HYPH|nr:hypothetical protein [Pseudochrobactrum asaccharolyticum]RBO91013.1 hypothetical protein DFR47_11010 [Pseudochrobactrum asaccharolyticum]